MILLSGRVMSTKIRLWFLFEGTVKRLPSLWNVSNSVSSGGQPESFLHRWIASKGSSLPSPCLLDSESCANSLHSCFCLLLANMYFRTNSLHTFVEGKYHSAIKPLVILRCNVYYEKKIIPSVCRFFSVICHFCLRQLPNFRKCIPPKCSSGHGEWSFGHPA